MSMPSKGNDPKPTNALQGTVFQHQHHKRRGLPGKRLTASPAESHVQPVAGILGETLLDERVLPSGRRREPHQKQPRPRHGKGPQRPLRRKRTQTLRKTTQRLADMKKIHYTDSYLLSPYHPVTVHVIGAGGTGSQVATNLARWDMALRALGHPGLHVTVFDPDTVSRGEYRATVVLRLRNRAEQGRWCWSHASTVSSAAHGRRKARRYPVRKAGKDNKGQLGKHYHHLHGQHPFPP